MLSTENPASNRALASDIIEVESLLEGASKEHQKMLLIEFLRINYEWADLKIDPKEIGHWDFGELWSLWVEIKNIPYMISVIYNGNRKRLFYIV